MQASFLMIYRLYTPALLPARAQPAPTLPAPVAGRWQRWQPTPSLIRDGIWFCLTAAPLMPLPALALILLLGA